MSNYTKAASVSSNNSRRKIREPDIWKHSSSNVRNNSVNRKESYKEANIVNPVILGSSSKLVESRPKILPDSATIQCSKSYIKRIRVNEDCTKYDSDDDREETANRQHRDQSPPRKGKNKSAPFPSVEITVPTKIATYGNPSTASSYTRKIMKAKSVHREKVHINNRSSNTEPSPSNKEKVAKKGNREPQTSQKEKVLKKVMRDSLKKKEQNSNSFMESIYTSLNRFARFASLGKIKKLVNSNSALTEYVSPVNELKPSSYIGSPELYSTGHFKVNKLDLEPSYIQSGKKSSNEQNRNDFEQYNFRTKTYRDDNQSYGTEVEGRTKQSRPTYKQFEKSPETQHTSKHLGEIYLIIDTNILIDNRESLHYLKGKMLYGNDLLILVIPYIVLQELDGLKTKSGHCKAKAQSAIKWINSLLSAKDPYLIGQGIDAHLEASEKLHAESGDENILNCCCYYQKKGKKVILLSNDINLRNRALISNIKAFGAKQLIQLVKQFEEAGNELGISPAVEETFSDHERSETYSYKDSEKRFDRRDSGHEFKPLSVTDSGPVLSSSVGQFEGQPRSDSGFALSERKVASDHSRLSSDSSEDLTEVSFDTEIHMIESLLGKVLEYAMIDAYGEDLWRKIIVHKPPWSAVEVLQCFDRHWIAVFIDKFSNEFKILVKELRSDLLESSQPTSDKKQRILKKIKLLFSLVKTEPYKSFINCDTSVEGKEIISNSSPKYLKTFSKNINKEDNKSASTSRDEVTFGSVHQIQKHGVIPQETIASIKESVTNMGLHAMFISNNLIDAVFQGKVKPDSGTLQSMQSLRHTLVTFGFTLKSLLEKQSTVRIGELVHQQILNYWKLAGELNPTLHYTDDEISAFAQTVEGREFFSNYLRDLEKLIQAIDAVSA